METVRESTLPRAERRPAFGAKGPERFVLKRRAYPSLDESHGSGVLICYAVFGLIGMGVGVVAHMIYAAF